MTEKEILQAHIDHAHHRADIRELVEAGTPTRQSVRIVGTIRTGLYWRGAPMVRDYANGTFVVLDEPRRG